MKIIYITLENLSLHKGSVVHVKEVIAGLRKRGHEVGLIAPSWNKLEEADHFCNLYRFFGFRRQPYAISSFLLFIYLFRVISLYDLIYARDFHTAIIALVPRLIFNKKLVLEINGLAHEEQRLKGDSVFNRTLAFLFQRTEKIATRSSNCVISVTHPIASYLNREFYCRKNKLKVVGNGVDTEKFRPIGNGPLLAEWRKKLGILEEEVVIAFVGNIAPWQGVNILVDSAFHLLTNSGKLKFLIVGDGFLKADLMKKVLDSGFEKEFIFTGMQRYYDIPFFINLADICVAPFIFERNQKTGVSPLKVFEYMACGKPVIASRIEGLEFIETEGAGRLIEPGDVKNLEEALLALLTDIQKRTNMGRKGLQIAREKFTWNTKVLNIEKILKELA